MKKKKMIIAVLMVCLLCVHSLGMVVRAEEAPPNQYYASNATDFRTYLSRAQDGDIITIMDSITLGVDIQFGSDTKHLTVKRGASYSRIIMGYGCNIDVRNVTFDGCGENATNAFIQTSANVTFTNCTFMNCGEGDHISNSWTNGGAFNVQGCSSEFNNCTFKDNYGLMGGHIAIFNDATVTLNECTMTVGGAVSNGGAVAVNSENATCHIIGCEITGNQALDYGGGVSNGGTLTVTGSRIYDNIATNGGADIATKVTGNTTLNDSIEQLNELFGVDNLQVTGWVCDYDFQEHIYIPDVNPEQDNALLKLSYSEIQPEPDEPTDPSDSDNTDDSGDTDNSDDSQPEEPGQNTPDDSTPGGEGSEGDNDSGGDSENTTNTDNSNTNTDSNNTSITDSNNVTNTDNSVTDNSVTDNSTTDNSSTDNSTTTNTTDNVTNTDNSSQVHNTDNSNTSTVTNGDTVTNTSNSSSDDHSDRSNVTNDNSNRSVNTTTDSSDRSTVYNYYSNQGKEQVQPGNVIVNITPDMVGSSGSSQNIQTVTPPTAPEISIDAKGVDCQFEYTESGGYKIKITASQVASVPDQAAVPCAVNTPVQTPDDEKSDSSVLPWLDMIEIVLLGAVLICLIWKPKRVK